MLLKKGETRPWTAAKFIKIGRVALTGNQQDRFDRQQSEIVHSIGG